MDRMQEWWRRVWYLLNRRRIDAALRREMEAHREEMTQPARFGNTLRLREDAQDAWGWRWLDELGRDLKLGLRTLRRSPGFAIASCVILSLGIGLNLALFQVVSATLVRPPRVKDPATLVYFHRRSPRLDSSGVPYPVATFVRDNTDVLSAVLVSRPEIVAWGDGDGERVTGAFVSANWFDELGASAATGRLLYDAIDGASSAPAVVVLGHQFWTRRLGGRSDVVGSTVRINGQPVVVAGVATAEFAGPQLDTPQLYLPIEQIEHYQAGHQLRSEVDMYGRLRPGVSPAAARASLQVTMGKLSAIRPDEVAPEDWLEPYSGAVRFMPPRERQRAWAIVAGIAGLAVLVLMIACLNLSNLTLARAISRVREMSIRTALGAGRARVIKHLVVESCLLATAGTVGGLLLMMGALRMLRSIAAWPVDFAPDWQTFIAAATGALVAMVAVGLAPVWKVGRRDLTLAARDGGERASQGLHAARLRHWLVGCQIAGSCVLLVVAGQMVRGLQRAITIDPGFSFERVAVLDPSLASFGVIGSAVPRYWDTVRALVAAHPETDRIAFANRTPPDLPQRSRYRSAPQVTFRVLNVDPEFFSTLNIPMLAGRTFRSDDARDVVVVSKRGVLKIYGTLDVLGQGFPKGEASPRIIGIVDDAQLSRFQSADMAEVYWPLEPQLANVMLARAKVDPSHLLGLMRDASRVANDRVVPETRLMRDDFDRELQSPRIASAIASVTALVALALVCVGIFGVVSYSAGLYTKEIGIRLALGANRGSTVRVLLRHTLSSSAVGLAVGLLGGGIASRAFAGEPFYLRPLDVSAYAAALVTLVGAGLVAALLPAWRTMRQDPLRALRRE